MGLNKEILRLAIPSILANITVPLVGMVDIAVAGNLDTSAAILIGGISIGTMLFDLLYWNFAFLRATTSGLTAQAYGRGNMKACADNLVRGLLLSAGIAAVILLLQWVFLKFVLLFVDCSPQVRDFAETYYFIRIWAAPATLSLMALKGWFIGMQDSFSSMASDLTVNVVNIACSVILSLGIGSWKGMGFNGIALGTVIAQYSGLLLCSAIILLKYRHLFNEYSSSDVRRVMAGKDNRRFMSMNTDLLVRSVCFMAIYEGFTVIAAKYGDNLLAVSTIMMKLLLVFSYFTDGFAYAGEALTGRFIGSGEHDMVRKSGRNVFAWSWAIAVVFTVVYGLWGTGMLNIMTKDDTVVALASKYIPWLMLMPLLGCAAFTWDGIYIGATLTRHIRNAMIAAALSFLFVWFIGKGILTGLINNGQIAGKSEDITREWYVHVLFGAYFAHLAARTIYLTIKKKSVYTII